MTIYDQITISIYVIFSILAVYFEYTDGYHAYRFNEVKDGEKMSSSLRKLKNCLECEVKGVKWRRVFIAALSTTLLIYLVGHGRFPNVKELVISVFFTFIIFYIMWSNYDNMITKYAVTLGVAHIENIKKLHTTPTTL